MKRMTFCLVTLAVLAMHAVLGCAKGKTDNDILHRLEQTRRDYQEFDPDPEILSALRSTTPVSLQRPNLIRARIYGHSKRLFVEWLEATPTPDNIRFVADKTNDWTIPIDDVYMEENRMTAKKHVLFRFCYVFEDNPNDWRRLMKILNNGGQLVMVQHGRVISNAVKLELVSQAKTE